MHILFSATGTKNQPWIDALREALPQATIEEWQPGDTRQADHAVVWSPPQRFFDEQPGIKGIFNMGAGVDALLKLKLPPQAMVVRIDDGGMAVQMAEFVCHALIRHFRELDGYEDDVRQGKWAFRRPNVRSDFPVGIMGLGVLGERVAQAVGHFEFPVLGWSRSPKALPGVRCFAGQAQFDDFLAATRVLVCLLPLTAETEGIMNTRSLLRLMPGGYVINVARGGHLVEEDLVPLLDSGQLAGATLDVFRTEPLPVEHPFRKHPKIVVTPHTSARTLRDETIAQIVGKIQAYERGEAIAGVVDPQRGY
jgi:glyoxylate/hydroxypyruvate reductase